MKLQLSIAFAILFSLGLKSQNIFQNAYTNNPSIPSGLLEAVAWNNTHLVHLQNQQPSCSGLPQAYGIMGLIDNGQNYFRENGAEIANLSGISIDQQKASAEDQIMAFALAYTQKSQGIILGGLQTEGGIIRSVLHSLSEIPNEGVVNQLAQDMQVYSVLQFLNSPEKAQTYNFTQHSIDLPQVFGVENFSVLSSQKIRFTEDGIRSDDNTIYTPIVNTSKSTEFGPAIWNPAPSCNFSSRSGTAISAITIHTIQGSYAGAISWAQNCNSNVSYHYVIRSSDGQVTQMVLEADKAWHVGSENPYTIGYEHEGYVDDASWYTDELYNSSAELSRDVCNSGYGIPPLRTYYGAASIGTNTLGACTKIKGHQHFPSQSHTDPGINWDWERYYRLINMDTPISINTSANGTFTDSGGASGDYQDDERGMWLFQPAFATNITLDFTSFDIELDWDKLFIYDGDSINDPILGVWTGTNSPGTITSSGGSILVEFRSDCGTVASGWSAEYSAEISAPEPVDTFPPSTTIMAGALWQTSDFTVDFTDSDLESGIAEKYYLVAEKTITESGWHSTTTSQFAHESFNDTDANWFPVTGTFSLSGNKYLFSDNLEENSNTYMSVVQNSSYKYLYEWDQMITSSESNQRAGMHFFCDNPNLSNRGNSYFVYLRENDNAVQILSVDNNVFNSESYIAHTINSGQVYNVKVTFDPSSGIIQVYIDDVFVSEWQDSTPLASGGYISLRTGGCIAEFDNVRVYHSRNNQVTISTANEMTIQSESTTVSGAIRTLVIDSARNVSPADFKTYLIDTTPPSMNNLYDGNALDIDSFYVSTIEANWMIDDIHSGISEYQVAIGTLPTLDDVYPWSTNGLSTIFSNVLTSPVYDEVYYISVRSTNNAGLTSEFTSDGQKFVEGLSINEINSALQIITVYPNPANEIISFLDAPNHIEVMISDAKGKVCIKKRISSNESISIESLLPGNYSVLLNHKDSFVIKQLIKK